MSDFDPSQPAILHDKSNDEIIPWTGEHQEAFRQSARYKPDGTVEWKGHLFDGWGNVLGG
jgi:hypothetical protein